MATQNVAYKEYIDDYSGKLPNIHYVEVSGIKLRDSLFVVYSDNNPSCEPEFFYNFKPMNGYKELIFDYDDKLNTSTGGPENCGVYKLDDQRILVAVS